MKLFIPNNVFKFLYYRIISISHYLAEHINPSQIIDYKSIPIIINNFNRLTYLKELIQSLEKRGYSNIYIIDNLSTYPPLLDYYKGCRHRVFRLEKNLGSYALWKSGLFKRFRNDFFVYTDSDVIPIDECPDDFLLFFLQTLKKYKLAKKVGFSLKIDDIPDHYSLKSEVIEFEKKYYCNQRPNELLFWAPIDTTFALYRPRATWNHANFNIEMYRTAFPYLARHKPWYINSKNPDDETRYYAESVSKYSSWILKDNTLRSSRHEL